MGKTAVAICTALALSIVPLSTSVAQTGGSGGSSNPSNGGPGLPSCPDLPDGLWTAICDAQFSAKRPGNYPFSIEYCCVHSTRDLQEACKRANLNCYRILIHGDDNPMSHALTLVEGPPGTCRFVDITGEPAGTQRGAIVPPNIGDITFPCDQDPPRAAICRAMHLPDDCKGTVVKEPSTDIEKPWTDTVCRNLKGSNQAVCAGCCTDIATQFYVAARHDSGSLKPGDSHPPDGVEADLVEMTRAWQKRCLNACEAGSSEPSIPKNPGERAAIDLCGADPSKRTNAGSTECIKCCDQLGQVHAYPTEDQAACVATCKSALGPPAKPKRKRLLPRLLPKPKRSQVSEGAPKRGGK